VFRILEIKCIAASNNNGIFYRSLSSNKTAAWHKGVIALSATTEKFLLKRIDLPCNPEGSTLRPHLAHVEGANGPLELKT
jgi:hypothetical protein